MRLFLDHHPSELSDIYLLDEHRTHHAMESVESLRQGHSLDFIKSRHDAVVAEMHRRGNMVRNGLKPDESGVGGNRRRFAMSFSRVHLTPLGVPASVDLSGVRTDLDA